MLARFDRRHVGEDERFADHAVEIGRRVVFSATGESA
jgi:phosphate uptake regulator